MSHLNRVVVFVKCCESCWAVTAPARRPHVLCPGKAHCASEVNMATELTSRVTGRQWDHREKERKRETVKRAALCLCVKSAVLDERAIVSMCVTDVNAGARAWVRPACNDAVSWVAQSGPQKWSIQQIWCVCWQVSHEPRRFYWTW